MDKELIYLTQTDTTVGFLSNSDKKLAVIKNRPILQKTLRVVDSFKTLKAYVRVPNQYKKMVRKSKKTSFIYPKGESFRVVDKNCGHHKFIRKFCILYSTSANESGSNFDIDFVTQRCDVEVLTNKKYFEDDASSIIKLRKTKYRKIR